MTVEQFSFDAHLREEDGEIFHHDPRSWKRKHLRARDDIIRDLKRRGYLDYDEVQYTADGVLFVGDTEGQLVDDFAEATVTVEFTATADGKLSVPEGTKVFDADPASEAATAGAVVFETDAALTVPAGTSDTVEATAEHPGEIYNVGAADLAYIDASLTNFDAVTNPDPASGGVDHQMTRVSVYRVLELVYMDLLSEQEDVFDYKRQLYADRYDEELDRMQSSGIDIDVTGDNQAGEGEEDLEHGGVRLHRS